jgi:hypothetical protein
MGYLLVVSTTKYTCFNNEREKITVGFETGKIKMVFKDMSNL